MSTYNVVDYDTGVEYVVVSRSICRYSGTDSSIAISPRYNADGSLYTSR